MYRVECPEGILYFAKRQHLRWTPKRQKAGPVPVQPIGEQAVDELRFEIEVLASELLGRFALAVRVDAITCLVQHAVPVGCH